MALDNMVITGCVFGLGAVLRAGMGYAIKVRDDPEIVWSWGTFALTTVPAFSIGFAGGSALLDVPEVFSPEWFGFMITSLVGGAGIGSVQSNLGKLLKKK